MLPIKRLYATLALTLFCVQSPAALASPAKLADSDMHTARLTEAHGIVYKRGFVDWNRSEWSEPTPAKAGEVLHEGMQVGTGDKSWAQIAWPHITTRAWANSVYAVAPNQKLIYLLGGEMLFQLDKNRKDKAEYCIWTKLLQARIRGTTVLFQSTAKSSKITVLEGTVDVLNRVDRSVVRLTPGVVYEITSKESVQGDASTSSTSQESDLRNIISADHKAVPLFETNKTTATVHIADVGSLEQHPLLSGFETPLASLPLVHESLQLVTSTLGTVTDKLGTVTDKLGKVTDLAASLLGKSGLKSIEILEVPKSLGYNIGPAIGSAIKLPPGANFFPPTALIGAPVADAATRLTQASTGVLPTNGLSPNLNLTQTTAGLGGTLGGLTNLTATPSAVSVSGLSSIGPSLPLAGGASTASIIGGGGGGVAGVVGGAGGAVGGVVGGVGGVVGGAVGGVGGLLGGLGGGGLGGLLGH